MPPLKNTLSWSYTNMRAYAACQRQYWYKKFGGWNGWIEKDPQSERRITWLLGKVQNRWMWRGDVVHGMIEHLLRGWRAGVEFDRAAVLEDLVQTFRAGFRASREGRLLRGNSKATGLAEHAFGEAVSNEEWKRLVDGASAMVERFLDSDVAAAARAVPADKWLSLEELLQVGIENATVYVKMDAAWHEGGRAVIVDWKTGKTETDGEGHSLQLGLYSIYADETWGLPAVVREVTLQDMTVREWEPTAADREALRERVATHISTIRGRTVETEHGIDADRDLFPPAPSAAACRGCAWRPICPDADPAARVDDGWRALLAPRPVGIPLVDAATAAETATAAAAARRSAAAGSESPE